MMEELADLKKEREELAQRLHDTEQLVNTVKNEKASVASELEQLQAQVSLLFLWLHLLGCSVHTC